MNSHKLPRARARGYIIYRGPSRLDGAPIVVIATLKSRNAKTGDMVQTWVMREDLDPLTALSGADASVCGDCVHRPINAGSCYVDVARAPLSVWQAMKRGVYPELKPAELPAAFAGSDIRCGAYGDPCAAPYQIWRLMLSRARSHTGYTHQWRDRRFSAFRRIVMASCDTLIERQRALMRGWRPFRVSAKGEARVEGEVICPASAEAGHKTICRLCRACGGTSSKARAGIVIAVHGSRAGRFQPEERA